MSSTMEPAIWSLDSGQRMPGFDSCQLTMKRFIDMKVNKANVQPRSMIWSTAK